MRTRVNLDIDVLRTFVTGMELGSFARAATRLGRSPSAISAQLRKLEDQIGLPLVQRSGRGLVLTEPGHALLSYAKRLVELNDDAVRAVRAPDLEGSVRLGLPADFAERWLPSVLHRFGKTYPRVKVEVHIEQSASLIERISHGTLDVALAWSSHPTSKHSRQIADVDLSWVGPTNGTPARGGYSEPVLLVVADGPCAIRATATSLLDDAGTPWRIAVATPSLAGVWASVEAGLGITLRATMSVPAHLSVIDPAPAGLPHARTLPLFLHVADGQLHDAAEGLTEMAVDEALRLVRPQGAAVPRDP